MVEIRENYKDFEPPRAALKAIKRFIHHTPEKYFAGLHSISLTNADALNRKLRRQKTKSRGKTVSLNNSSGWYVEKWNNEPAYIVLLIDKILDGYPLWALKINLIADVALSGTFFHELGHHVHKTRAPEHLEREDVADKWKRRLSRKFFWKKHWYFLVLIMPFKPLFDWLLKRYDEKQKLTSASRETG
jgi:hypothetical protein